MRNSIVTEIGLSIGCANMQKAEATISPPPFSDQLNTLRYTHYV
jgi:hypothetical protein